MADLTPLYDALRKADEAGDTDAAQKLAAYIKTQKPGPRNFDAVGGHEVPTGSEAAKAAQDPSAGASTLQPFGVDTGIPLSQGANRFLSGAGKATVDISRGAGQMVGAESRADVQASRDRDAPLMATGAGKAGFLAGTVADMLPAAWIPGAATLGGAAAIGAGTGLLAPSTSTGETAENTALGGLMGPAALALGRGAGALYQGVKGAIEPLFRGGQERVAARTLQAFAGGPQRALQASQNIASNGANVLPGVQPTTAELADNAGIAQFERSLRNNPEHLTALTERNQANRTAMTGALGDIAGTPAEMSQAQQARTSMTTPLYQAASQTTVPADADLGRLLARPSMQRAWERAQTLAQEEGITLTQPNANDVSGQTLQYLKMALNDMRDTAEQRGIGAHEQRALDSTLGAFNRWTTRSVPQLRAADSAYQHLSGRINQMQVGGNLRDSLVPALGDFGNNTRLSAANYANSLRNGDQFAARATGQPQLGLADVLNPNQQTSVRQIGEQLARRANADELGRAAGSNTGQNLVSQNVLRQFLGPLGMPQGMGERAAQSALGQSLLRPLQWTAQAGEPRIMNVLANAALNPQEAQRLLTLAAKNPKLAKVLWDRQGLLGAGAQGVRQGLLADATQQ